MIAAFADIVELARSKLAGSKTGLAYTWMLMLEGCFVCILIDVLKLLLLISSCITCLKLIGAASLLCFLSKRGLLCFQ